MGRIEPAKELIRKLEEKLENLKKVNQNVKLEISEKLRAALESQYAEPEPMKLANQVPQPQTRINLSQMVLSQTVCPTNNNRPRIELPSKAQRKALIVSGIHDLWLAAFDLGGKGAFFNFVLSNQMITKQKDPDI